MAILEQNLSRAQIFPATCCYLSSYWADITLGIDDHPSETMSAKSSSCHFHLYLHWIESMCFWLPQAWTASKPMKLLWLKVPYSLIKVLSISIASSRCGILECVNPLLSWISDLSSEMTYFLIKIDWCITL